MSSASDRSLALTFLIVILVISISIFVYMSLSQKKNNKVEYNITNNYTTNELNRPETQPPYSSHKTDLIYPSVPMLYNNIRTRPESNSVDYTYRQVGTLTDAYSNIYPLYGKQTYINASRWNYYTKTNTYNSAAIPLIVNGRNCNDELGCPLLVTGNIVFVPEFGNNFTVMIYNNSYTIQ